MAAAAAGRWSRRWVALLAALLLPLGTLGWLTARALGESTRVSRTVDAHTATLQADIQADCAFKLDIARLPEETRRAGGRVGQVLVRIAEDARIAFLGKHCPTAVDSRTGRPFGTPPTIGPADPDPTPTPTGRSGVGPSPTR
jgi:hypothetical protein